MPASLIDQEDGVGSWCDHLGNLSEMQVHRLGVAGRQDQGRAFALFWADSTEDIGGGGALVTGRTGTGAALGQRRAILFFWPIRASSWNQTSILSLSIAFSRAIASKRAGKFF